MKGNGLLASAALMLFSGPCIAAQLVSVNPVAIDFGKIKVGDEVDVAVTISNPGNVDVSLAGGGVDGDFLATNGCGPTVTASSSCEIVYSFKPSARTSSSESTSLAFSANGYNQSVDISLTGTGVESLAQVYPVGVEFGSTPVGASMSVPITVHNSHTDALGGFAGGGVFAPFSASTNCGGGVAAGASCAFTYEFTAPSSGEFLEDTGFSFQSEDITQGVQIDLSATGTNAASIAKAAPVSIDFGRIKRGKLVSVPVVIENISAGNLENFAGGGVDAPFSAYQDCTSGVSSGETCAFTYQFLPDSAQRASETTGISFTSSSGGSQSIQIELTGRATGTLARVSPVAIDFGAVRLGESVTVPVTVFNDSDSMLSSFAGGGVGSADFYAQQSCAGGVDIGESCAFFYTFDPTTEGDQQASTGFSFSNETGLIESVEILLSGNGTDAIFSDRFQVGN